MLLNDDTENIIVRAANQKVKSLDAVSFLTVFEPGQVSGVDPGIASRGIVCRYLDHEGRPEPHYRANKIALCPRARLDDAGDWVPSQSWNAVELDARTDQMRDVDLSPHVVVDRVTKLEW